MLLKWNREEINNLVRNTLINCKTMRKKNVLMSAIAALAFAACSSDDVLLEQDTGIVTNPTGNAWVALDIKTPSVSRSRALHDPNKEDGTAEESSVSTVRAIFDASEQLTDDIELTGVEAGNPGQPNGGVSKPFKVDAKSKRILIIANPEQVSRLKALLEQGLLIVRSMVFLPCR